LAHSAADKKLQVMEDFSDADKLLERTVDIVDRLNLTIDRAGYNYETTQKNAALRAEYFWQFIIDGLRQTKQS
jgi:DNA polymerase III alpha subunit